MNKLWPIALVTFKEGVRNRSVYGIFLLALFLLCANFFTTGMALKDTGKITIDIALSSVSLAGLLLVLFVGINLIAKDMDRRTIFMILSRPISRSQYLIGKFLGVAMLIAATLLMLSVMAMLSIIVFKLQLPDGNQPFSWTSISVSLFFIMLSYILLSALSFLFSSFASTSFITLLLTVVSYLIGISLEEIRTLIGASKTGIAEVPELTSHVVQIVSYLLPNLSLFDVKLQAAHGLPIEGRYIVWTTLYGIVYVCLTTAIAALIFRKKEFS